jgi:hypothetical protein
MLLAVTFNRLPEAVELGSPMLTGAPPDLTSPVESGAMGQTCT